MNWLKTKYNQASTNIKSANKQIIEKEQQIAQQIKNTASTR